MLILILSVLSIDAFAAKPPTEVTLKLLTGLPSPMIDGQQYTFEVRANEKEAEGYVFTGTTSSLTSLADPNVTYKRNSVTAEFVYEAKFGDEFIDIDYASNAHTASLRLNILVEGGTEPNNPPAFTSSDTFNTDEDTVLDFTATADDGDGDTLTFGIDTHPSPSQGILTHSGGGSFSFEPAADYNGNASFVIDVSDGTDTVTQAVTVSVAPENDPPVINGDYDFTVAEGGTHTFAISATDVDGDPLTYSEDSPHATISGNTVTYTAGSTSGNDSFNIGVSDGELSDIQLVNVTITEVNVGPEFTGTYSFNIDEDTVLDFTATATDDDGDPLTFDIDTHPQASEGIVKNLGGGSFRFEPVADYNGTVNFIINVSDGTDTVTQAVTVLVDPVNDAPVINDNYDFTVEEGGSHTFDISATDVDGDALIYGEDSPDATISGNEVTYTAGSAPGTHYFNISVSDGSETVYMQVVVTVTESGEIVYLALGDSIPYGTYYSSFWNYVFGGTDTNSYAEQLATQMGVEPANFHDESVSGHNAVDVYNQIPTIETIIMDADVITLSVGANDIMDAAGRGMSGLQKYNITWSTADTGRDNFEFYWWQIIDRIEELNPDVKLVVMTIYNPYHEDDPYTVDGVPIYDKVDEYFTSSASGNMGLNHIINNTMTLYDEYLVDGFDYQVADVYTGFNSPDLFGRPSNDKDDFTGFYSSFCDPHPNQTGQNFIYEIHSGLVD